MVNPALLKPPSFENLDALRFLSFMAVFFSHCLEVFNYQFPFKLVQAIHLHSFGNGRLGVNFFFVLSGFLISWLLFVEKEKNKEIQIKAFYIRRMLRIWPVYYAVVVAGFLSSAFLDFSFIQNDTFQGHMRIDQLPWYLFFLSNFDIVLNGVNNFLLPVLWSVSVEEQFYLFWPLIFSLFISRQLKYVCLAIVFTSFIYRCFFSGVHQSLSTAWVMSDLAVGALACYYSFYSRNFQLIVKTMSGFKIKLIYFAFLIYFLWHGFSHYFGESVYAIYYPFESLLFSLFFAFIIVEQNFSDNSFFKFGRVKFTSGLGKISYGLYAYHMITFPISFYVTKIIHINDYTWIGYGFKIVLSLSLTILVSQLSYRYFEAPFLRYKKKFSVTS